MTKTLYKEDNEKKWQELRSLCMHFKKIKEPSRAFTPYAFTYQNELHDSDFKYEDKHYTLTKMK
uniref:Uncharacterized protein n=1 Tax=viral metagenome TaxID=1070528 RepID=A0A6C0CTM8_9ZZZZ